MRIAIVGAEESKWSKEQQRKVKQTIKQILGSALELFKPDDVILVSGHCPKGGVDIWAEEIAKELGIKTEIYAPEVNQWEDEKMIEHGVGYSQVYKIRKGYKSRNILIAEACDILYDIEPAHSCKYCKGKGFIITTLPDYRISTTENFVLRRKCKYCESDGAYSDGTWTLKYARKLGKEVHKVIIE
jgi:hypothetical protein